MMQLIIGDTIIDYSIRHSKRATRKRIIVTPGGVEVVVPTDTPFDGPDGVGAYVAEKRRWVFNSVQEIGEKHRALLSQQFASGAKLQYRGRWLMLDVRSGPVPRVQITCRSKFHVLVPNGLDGAPRVEAIRKAFDAWLQARAIEEVERFTRRHAATLDLSPSGNQLAEARRRWGSCGKDGVIRIHWRLIQAPTPAFEYVVAHEVIHLAHRNHSPEFWSMLSRTLPDWPERKLMLERWEVERRMV